MNNKKEFTSGVQDVDNTDARTQKIQKKQMVLGVALGNNFGIHQGAWRMPHVDPNDYTNIDAAVKQIQAAERGGLQFIFLSDFFFMKEDLSATPPMISLDVLITLAALSQATERIGLIGTASTSFTEPYLLARQLKALDVISRGRIGWNAVPSYDAESFANFGKTLPPREKKYERLHEVVQIVQALWGSWEYEAGQPDQNGMFADPTHVRPVNLHGQHVGTRGPLPIPPSEQGQPVVVMPAGSSYGLQAAAMYANVIIGRPSSIEESRALRNTVRNAAEQAGRNADEVKLITFAGFTIGDTKREALDKRAALDDKTDIHGQLRLLSAYLGLNEELTQTDEPLTEAQLAAVHAHPLDTTSQHVVELAKAGWSPRDILAHAVLEPYPTVVGTGEQAADLLQEWYEADATDGFLLIFDDFNTGIDDFVDHVVPVLQERGIFHDDYEGRTFRDHFGLPPQYGLDPRIITE
ncbi:NtaA/DmoA family FMN-dependent monooxygenase [Domibacillus sp. DTU_2020_1001157_1_SI_ALB_TIR_016]|uniref:NtaA/DmoA family FMN-dependent monooxygenase n=1 Tax=Domibacillus sp. DTU_2020_1001157_1_SI_ALB_TIR_016 TaxID=3077789 RepID=UPI0028EE2DB7|nr:NtaA/DmoA family FMN-dependent monooxygenase [Domibacillus sp. DTU_2020_1001157_1_SI_ALB_TIR_016]WNS77780.1 NtaA/DmoA family FMN-dependent monooxygenase [Domibacillus sp. DTU_2020_1001157_1_SI_ALB_TIR_016]